MSFRFGLHAPVEPFTTRDGCLCIGDVPVTAIMEQYGPNPVYAYDRRLIERRIEMLTSRLPDRTGLHYAIKANPMPEVVEHVSGLVDGLDIASAGELQIALQTSCNPSDMSFAGPGKKPAELEAAVSAGVTLNVESSLELERIAQISSPNRPRVALRVNPDFELKSSGMKMAGGPKQFGIDAEQVPRLLSRLDSMTVDFRGFHIFSGAQNLNADAICESQQKALDLALELSSHAACAPAFINIGGGFGIPYFPGDNLLDLDKIFANLRVVRSKLDSSYPDCELVLELGRYLVGEAGVYLSTVIDKKVSRGHTFLVVDGGLHHHLAASGNFGQILRKNYPVTIANRIESNETEVASIVGPLCTPLDLLADRMELPKAEVGDTVAVFQSGAYGFTASPLRFLSHPPPTEVLI